MDFKVDEYYLPLSAIQHYAYCPRQFALIHIEQAWCDNFFTAHGHVLHERVDSGVSESRGDIRTERGVDVISHQFRVHGKLDMLEIVNNYPKRYKPIEYKRGKPKIEDWDRIQLCGQVICLEEMLETTIDEAEFWYWQIRRRENIVISSDLRDRTLSTITAAHELYRVGETPKSVYKSKLCRACSLVDICGVKNFKNDRSFSFVEELFNS